MSVVGLSPHAHTCFQVAALRTALKPFKQFSTSRRRAHSINEKSASHSCPYKKKPTKTIAVAPANSKACRGLKNNLGVACREFKMRMGEECNGLSIQEGFFSSRLGLQSP